MYTIPLKKVNLSILFLALSIMLSAISWAASDDPMRGQPFSNPSQSSSMPESWKNKPVQYVPDFMKADIVIDLNQQIEPLLNPLVKDYAKKQELKIISTMGTCGKSAGKIDRKEVDIGGFCCPPGEKDRLPGLKYHTWGITPLAFFVHPENPVKDITLAQLRQIFQGIITNWSEVGGKDMPIKKIASSHCKHRPGHWRLMLKSDDFFSPDILLTGEMEDMIAFVAENRAAIGFETVLVAKRFKNRGPVRALKINGHTPTPDNLASLDYSVYRVFNFTTWDGDTSENKHAKGLVNYLMSKGPYIAKEAEILPAAELRKAGWLFQENELIGEPAK